MKPMMEPEMFHRGVSAVSLAAFPKDTSPLTVIFGTGSASTSRRNSKRDSYISLYDNPSPDDWFAAAAAQAAAATAGGIGISPVPYGRTREMRTGSFSKAFWSVTSSSLNTLSTTQLMSVFPKFFLSFFFVVVVLFGCFPI